ncbi:MAG: hypothetical protein GY858_04145 [Candidatus Omnitrophica bacterium]|nr:hypothetical protein [Candidatus Omnitrophota bacterium]
MIPCIKGQMYNQARKTVTNLFGPDALEMIMQEMNQQGRMVLQSRIAASSWQPKEPFVRLIALADEIFGCGDYAVSEKIGTLIAKESIPTIYKIFIKFGDPGYVITRGSRLWNQLNNYGRLKVDLADKNSAVAALYENQIPHKAYCHYLMGYSKGTLEVSGAHGIAIKEISCQLDGADHCEFIAKWY